MERTLPVYDLNDFKHNDETADFYVNRLKPHIAAHTFTNLPHKHDFYLVMLVTKGSGLHEIDFEKYKVTPGTVFVMQPGQMHYWKLSPDIDGFVFFHSRTFFEEGLLASSLRDFPFYKSFQSLPLIKLNKTVQKRIEALMKELFNEHQAAQAYKNQKLHALVNLIYIELSRSYMPGKQKTNQTYLAKAHEFENLIEKHFIQHKSAGYYASVLNISEKHLNRIVQTCFRKTTMQLIADRIILEAKRMLIHSGLNVSQIAEELQFNDTSYFVRFFKKNAGETPTIFLKRYNH